RSGGWRRNARHPIEHQARRRIEPVPRRWIALPDGNSMTGKISEDPDRVVNGTEKFAAAAGGSNFGILASSIATYLASLAQTLTNRTINAANNTVSGLTTTMFAANVVDTDSTFAANSDTRIPSQKAVKTATDALSGS